jgi:hypothetical protein
LCFYGYHCCYFFYHLPLLSVRALV